MKVEFTQSPEGGGIELCIVTPSLLLPEETVPQHNICRSQKERDARGGKQHEEREAKRENLRGERDEGEER